MESIYNETCLIDTGDQIMGKVSDLNGNCLGLIGILARHCCPLAHSLAVTGCWSGNDPW